MSTPTKRKIVALTTALAALAATFIAPMASARDTDKKAVTLTLLHNNDGNRLSIPRHLSRVLLLTNTAALLHLNLFTSASLLRHEPLAMQYLAFTRVTRFLPAKL